MVLSLFLLTSFLIGRTKCIPFSFAITPNSDSGYYAEKNLSFSLSVSAKNVIWDFGDGTAEKTGVYITHHLSSFSMKRVNNTFTAIKINRVDIR